MNQHENSVYGRKIFFIEPQSNISQFVIPKLIENEYEIYSLDNYKQAKACLKKNPDSIVFVCINPKLTINGWYHFIKSFEEDEVLSTMVVGILVQYLTKSDRELLLIHTELPAGLVTMVSDPDTMARQFMEIFEINGAKGRRKYVRADCSTDKTAYITLTAENQRMQFPLEDISSVGLAFSCSNDKIQNFPEKSLFRNCIINLKSETVICDCAVIMQKTNEKKAIIVMLFTKESSFQTKTILHTYVYNRNQVSMEPKYILEPEDPVDYEHFKPKTTDAQTNSDELEVLEDLEEV